MLDKYEAMRSPFDAYTDEQLCVRAASGDNGAETALVTRYYSLVRVCARPLFLTGGDGEDLIQEGMLGLIRAIREYQRDKNTSFRTFAEVCIRNRLYSALRAAARDKHAPLNQSISLDHPSFDGDACFSDDPAHSDPELLIADRDYVESILSDTGKDLSDFESTVLGYYLEGLSCQEIAQITHKSPKSIDNAVQRVRRKTARHLGSGGER